VSDFTFSDEFAGRLNEEARRLGVYPEDRLAALIEAQVARTKQRDWRAPIDYSSRTLALPEDLAQRVVLRSTSRGLAPAEFLEQVLDRIVTPRENLEPGALERGLEQLRVLLVRIPPVHVISTSKPTATVWWVKLKIDLDSPIAWNVIQNLAFVLNGISVQERLPTVFKPDSPPPYLNGGPRQYLSWVVEATIPLLNAGVIAGLLEERLPEPLEDEDAWLQVEPEEEAWEAEPVDIEAWKASRRQPDLKDCEQAGATHRWFNIDDVHSGCYNCRVIREGRLWEHG
jgi:hypothetical protein